jgi:hypothetical protein
VSARTFGHLYVIRFANGIVKVGRSATPTARVQVHKAEAERHGNALAEHWTSPAFEGFDVAEATLIGWCAARAGTLPHAGREWFSGLDYLAAVGEATRLADAAEAERVTLAERLRVEKVERRKHYERTGQERRERDERVRAGRERVARALAGHAYEPVSRPL